MLLKEWDKIPAVLQNDAVLEYYDLLKNKTSNLIIKRVFDILFSLLFIVVFSPVFLIIGIAVAVSSGFPIIYKQSRVTQYNKEFKVFKFRTMVKNADKRGSLVTVDNDSRITKIGSFLRRYRLDELPQIFNVLGGSMTLVGTRPEVREYVDDYTDEMMATLLLPAGITSLASIEFKDEAQMLKDADNVHEEYVKNILPLKMRFNLEYIKKFSFLYDLSLLFKTLTAVIK